jgi:hypothetical protein
MPKIDLQCAFCDKPAVSLINTTSVCKEHKDKAVEAFATQLMGVLMPQLQDMLSKTLDDAIARKVAAGDIGGPAPDHD